jgi:hypothetical protein
LIKSRLRFGRYSKKIREIVAVGGNLPVFERIWGKDASCRRKTR